MSKFFHPLFRLFAHFAIEREAQGQRDVNVSMDQERNLQQGQHLDRDTIVPARVEAGAMVSNGQPEGRPTAEDFAATIYDLIVQHQMYVDTSQVLTQEIGEKKTGIILSKVKAGMNRRASCAVKVCMCMCKRLDFVAQAQKMLLSRLKTLSTMRHTREECISAAAKGTIPTESCYNSFRGPIEGDNIYRKGLEFLTCPTF